MVGECCLIQATQETCLHVPQLIFWNRVVVFSVLLVNAHTWGLNSSYAVFLAYYLRSGTIDGASPLGFAFVGGLSISICTSPPFRGLKTLADRLSEQLFWFLQ
jgi:hypothetical protein